MLDLAFDLIMIIASIVMSYAPVLLYVYLIWWLDRYEREPIKLIGLAFLWGAIGSSIISLIFDLILEIIKCQQI